MKFKCLNEKTSDICDPSWRGCEARCALSSVYTVDPADILTVVRWRRGCRKEERSVRLLPLNKRPASWCSLGLIAVNRNASCVHLPWPLTSPCPDGISKSTLHGRNRCKRCRNVSQTTSRSRLWLRYVLHSFTLCVTCSNTFFHDPDRYTTMFIPGESPACCCICHSVHSCSERYSATLHEQWGTLSLSLSQFTLFSHSPFLSLK